MRVPFRQGIVSIPKDTGGNQLFLQQNGSGVDLITSSGRVVVNFAHRQANYLHTEHNSTSQAWPGPFVSGTDYWLFWEIDTRNATRSFGTTELEPVSGPTPPIAPALDQMWFDTAQSQMKVFNGSGWLSVVRCIACKISSGSVIEPWNGGSEYEGTQVGLNHQNDAGAIAYDEADSPLRRSNNTFFTTTDRITAGVDVVSSIVIDAMQFYAEAESTIAAFSVVALTDFGRIRPAGYNNLSDSVFGVILDDVSVGQQTTIITSGIVTNPQWNWPTVNALLYFDENGQLTTSIRPGITPVGYVVEPTKILLRSAQQGGGRTNSSVYNRSAQGYENASGTVTINTGIFWHVIEQSGPINLAFDAPTGNVVDEFQLEILSDGSTIGWPDNAGSFQIPAGSTRIFNVTFRPEINGIPAKFVRTESNLV